MRWFGVLSLLAALACPSLAADESPRQAVKKLATEMVDATLKGDCALTIDHTYPGIVKGLGGRKQAIEATEKAMKQMKHDGFVIKEVKVGEPGELLAEGMNTFVVVPTTMGMTFPGGTLRARSYLLGISADGGKTWTFADGAGLRDKESSTRLLPKLPGKLKLPEAMRPEVVPKGK